MTPPPPTAAPTAAPTPVPAPPARRWARTREELLIAGLFVAVGILGAWPVPIHLATRLSQGVGDPLENAWIFDWAAHAMAHGPRHLFHANMFSPEPFTLAYAESMLGLSLPLAPVVWLTGNPILAANLALVAVYALSGYTTYLLARDLTGTRVPAVLAGVLFTLSPYRLSQLEHIHVLATHFVPIVLLLLFRLRREPSLRLAALLGLALGAQVWTSLTGALLATISVGTWVVWFAVVDRRHALRALRPLLAAAAIAVVTALPPMLPYLRLRQIHPEYRHSPEAVLMFSATAGSYISAPDRPMLVSSGAYTRLRDAYSDERGAWEKRLFPGFALTASFAAAAALAMWRRLRGTGRRRQGSDPASASASKGPIPYFLALGLVAWVLSLGPRWGARGDGFPLPYAALSAVLPAENLSRVTARVGTLVPLAMAMVVALVLAAATPRRRRIVGVAVLAIALLELAPARRPFPELLARTPAHEALASRPGAMLGLPTHEADDTGRTDPATAATDTIHLYASTAHHRPMLNGYGAFQPLSYWDMVGAVQHFPDARSLAWLQGHGVRTVVVQTGYLKGTHWEGVVERLRAWPGIREIGRGDGVRVYDIPAASDAERALSPRSLSEP